MEVMEKFFNYISSRQDTLILLWEKNSGWCSGSKSSKIFEFNSSEVSIEMLSDFIHADDKLTFTLFIDSLKYEMSGNSNSITENEEKFSIAVRMKCYNISYQYCNIECWFEREENALCRIFVMISIMDATESYRTKIAESFTSDRNPALIGQQAAELVANNPDKKFTVIQFDVIKFKMINEQYGETTGDELLQFIMSTLKVICNSLQVFSRLSADVFMIITPYETDEDIYQFISLLDKYLLGYKNMSYSLVYGICYIGDLKGGLRQYGDYAAMARQNLKGNALTHIAFYKEEIKKNLFTNKIIEDQMEHALSTGQFAMYLQPKCSIHSGTLIGAEALVRWIHPTEGVISPFKFIPLFEKNGFIIKLDHFIWEEACKKIRSWLDNGKDLIPISVNMSRKHLANLEFIAALNALTQKYNIPKEYLEIEITESIDEYKIEDGITELKNNGYTLLMDDFGSGYSSLNTLKNTQFDIIKLDKGFLEDFSGTERGRDIVKHTVSMIQNIGMDVIAEGVETIGQAEFLEGCGCHTAQGYYYDKPLPSDSFESKYMK